MDALDEVKDKMPEDAYLMLCDASKEKYARLSREEAAGQEAAARNAQEEEEEDEVEQGEEQGEEQGGIQIILS